MNAPFSPELQQLLQQQMADGQYASADALLVEAVRLLAHRNRRREELRRELQIGRDQLDQGQGIVLDDDEALEAFLDQIQAEVMAETMPEKQSEGE